MSIKTRSVFYYGHTVDDSNYAIDFTEGENTINAEMPVGDYSLSGFVAAIEVLLNKSGDNTYSVTLNRDSRFITITSSGEFGLLVGTGSSFSMFGLMGFSGDDKPAAMFHIGSVGSGMEWRPQHILESYDPKENNLERISPSINESTSGEIESLFFGERVFIRFNAKLITNIEQKSRSIVEEDINGVGNAISFLTYITTKAKFEFMPDRDNRSDFVNVLLERIRGSSSGTGFMLEKMFGEAGQQYYETGLITMRVL